MGFHMARGLFEEAYLSLPPWDIGRPQGKSSDLRRKGDPGPSSTPGAGQAKTLFSCDQGYEVTGSTLSGRHPEAKKKSRERGCPLFSSNGMPWRFPDSEAIRHGHRLRVVPRLLRRGASLVCRGTEFGPAPGGIFRMLCFSEMEPGIGGRVGSHRMRFARRSRGVGRSPRSGKRVLRRTGAGRLQGVALVDHTE